MFIPSQLSLKRLAACCGVVSLLFTAPVMVIAEESSNNQVLLAQQSDELERAKQQARQAAEQIDAGNWEEAITLLEQALPVFKTKLGSEHSFVQALEYLLTGS